MVDATGGKGELQYHVLTQHGAEYDSWRPRHIPMQRSKPSSGSLRCSGCHERYSPYELQREHILLRASREACLRVVEEHKQASLKSTAMAGVEIKMGRDFDLEMDSDSRKASKEKTIKAVNPPERNSNLSQSSTTTIQPQTRAKSRANQLH
ncbi:uncharacterized protein BCR38DRAFT_492031 [Pseudomassariella vexata]|uniref:Uncharacterized protein n=1 Tax=Pseudomassariella vexata TaxID=1141098 RepID=A0A1Y2EIN4_9PEZI|nr:uncharacterized protein BCR38DRAFT_492031 [Pseudomassariella vexata]ORY71096.1 hypothetical protein BCR38DRAFT_492031 [Pseudomassariella vexata]